MATKQRFVVIVVHVGGPEIKGTKGAVPVVEAPEVDALLNEGWRIKELYPVGTTWAFGVLLERED